MYDLITNPLFYYPVLFVLSFAVLFSAAFGFMHLKKNYRLSWFAILILSLFTFPYVIARTIVLLPTYILSMFASRRIDGRMKSVEKHISESKKQKQKQKQNNNYNNDNDNDNDEE